MASTLKHTFLEPPKPGFELTDNGFRYVVTAARAHTNQKGEPSAIVTWRGWCAHDGQPFEFKTGAKVYALARRCKAHNAGWSAATPYTATPGRSEPQSTAEDDEDRVVTTYEVLQTFSGEVLRPLALGAHKRGDMARAKILFRLSQYYSRWLDFAIGEDDDDLAEWLVYVVQTEADSGEELSLKDESLDAEPEEDEEPTADDIFG